MILQDGKGIWYTRVLYILGTKNRSKEVDGLAKH